MCVNTRQYTITHDRPVIIRPFREISGFASLVAFTRALLTSAGIALRLRPALGRELAAQQHPRADEKSGAHNRRRCDRGKILRHNPTSTRDWLRSAAGPGGRRASQPTQRERARIWHCTARSAARKNTAPGQSGAKAAQGGGGTWREPARTAGRHGSIAPPRACRAAGKSGRSQPQQHARVAQGVRLDPVQIEELGDPLVV